MNDLTPEQRDGVASLLSVTSPMQPSQTVDQMGRGRIEVDMDALFAALLAAAEPGADGLRAADVDTPGDGLDVEVLTRVLAADERRLRPSVYRGRSWGWYRNFAERLVRAYRLAATDTGGNQP